MIPKCLQQIEESLVAWYNFAPPKFKYARAFPDIGPWGRNLNPLTIDNQWTEPTAQFDPIYVNEQGLYFDSDTKSISGSVPISSTSFSVEMWVKIISNTGVMRMVSKNGF